ncbi:MAG TPA: porin family protein [Bacteroidales bacterium]|jgi:hypothetical protein|nr:porin family protein [Bacteroidales bacterium]HPE40775.1 porin family protein [Bacteroidales bacterium]
MKKRSIIITLLVLLISVNLYGQKRFGVPNLLKYDKQRFHFGFLIGFNQFDFSIRSKANLMEYDSLMKIYTTPLAGFNLGIVTNMRLGEYFDLRFIPGLAFGDRVLNYSVKYHDGREYITYKYVESVYMEFPLLVKFKSSRMHNVRVYVIGGAQYSRDLVSNARKQASNPREVYVKIYPNDFQAQAGFGFDFYMTYFKFSTEFKMSFGLNNLLKVEPNMYATSVTDLRSRMVQISFLFE